MEAFSRRSRRQNVSVVFFIVFFVGDGLERVLTVVLCIYLTSMFIVILDDTFPTSIFPTSIVRCTGTSVLWVVC